MIRRKNAARIDRRTARLIDANLNRAREGLRVVEDAARFLWDDADLYRRIRDARHRLDALSRRHYRDLIESRDSRADAGRRLPESGRTSVAAVVAANIRRAQEASRVLEEFSKVFSRNAAPTFKAIRYALYDVEKRLLRYP